MSEWDNNSQSQARTPPLRALVPREVEELQNPQAFRKVPRAEKELQKTQGQMPVIASVSNQNLQ